VQRWAWSARRFADRSSRPADAALRARLRGLAAIRRRFGYRRLHVLMRREDGIMEHQKLRRLYRSRSDGSNPQVTFLASICTLLHPTLTARNAAN
jgi:hypothetical protein